MLVLFAADIHYMLDVFNNEHVVPIDWRNLDVFGIQALQAVEAISLGSHQTWLVYVDFSGTRIFGYNIIIIYSILF